MYFNYVLLFMGITDLILGLISYFRKGEAAKKYLLYSYKIINEELEAKSLEKIEKLSKVLGQLTCVEGALYIFLASTAIYSNMNLIIVILLIVIIELSIFSMKNNIIKKFVK